MDLGKLIASTRRQKILETLFKFGETHLMDLVRKVNSTYVQVNRNVQILEEGIVKTQWYGRLRIVRLNRENPRTDIILKVLKILSETQTKRL